MALRRRDLDAAIKHFRDALSAEPYDRVSPMQLAQALRLKGDVAAADAYVDRVRRLNRLYNLIVRVRSPGHENQVSDLAELGRACEDAGLDRRSQGLVRAGDRGRIRWTTWPSRGCTAWADRRADRGGRAGFPYRDRPGRMASRTRVGLSNHVPRPRDPTLPRNERNTYTEYAPASVMPMVHQ